MHIAITGASSGIGKALAQAYGTGDNKLSLVARRKELLEELAGEVDCPASVYPVDLSLVETSADWVEKAEEEHGLIDVLVNNAGMQYVEPAVGVSYERAEKLMQVNLLAPLKLLHLLAPQMVERKQGSIVNVCSIAGIALMPGSTHYSASKSGLAAVSEGFHVELKKSGVHICTVYPGPVTTPMETAAREKMGNSMATKLVPTGSPKGLAKLIQKAVRKKRRRVVYPRIYFPLRHLTSITQWCMDTFTPPPQG